MSEITKTTDYNKIKIHEHNRAIDQAHVKRLMNSINSNNLLDLCPIILDKNMCILDGQHRFEAAKNLNVPIYYKIDQKATEKIIPILNSNSKKWTIEDFINYYASKGYQEFQNLIDLSKKYDLSIISITSLLGRGSTIYNKMRAGKLNFNKKEIDNKLEKLFEAVEIIKEHLPSTKINFIRHKTFLRALCVFLQNDQVDHKQFLHKLKMGLSYVRRCVGVTDYLEMWFEIYNYHRKKPREIIEQSPQLSLLRYPNLSIYN